MKNFKFLSNTSIGCLNYLNSSNASNTLNTGSLKEVHHSLDPRGGALFFQKIMINKIFKCSMGRKVSNHSKLNVFYSTAIRHLNIGNSLFYKYSYLSENCQFKKTSLLGRIFNINNVGFFSNLSQERSFLGGSLISKDSVSTKVTESDTKNNYFFISSFNAGNLNTYSFRCKRAVLTLDMKSRHLLKNWNPLFSFSIRNPEFSIKESLALKFSNNINFLRTYWYTTTINLNNFWFQKSHHDFSGKYSFFLKKKESINKFNSNAMGLEYFLSLSYINPKGVDSSKNLKAGPKGKGFYRRYMRNQTKWRIGMAYWAKKIWQFKKTYRFWRYMRGMSKYFYRGFHMYSIYLNRVDLFVLRMFSVKNLRYARVLIKAGHIFYGNRSCTNYKQRVKRFSVVSMSLKSKNWSNTVGGRFFRKYNKKSNTKTENKWSLRLIKNPSLSFIRNITHTTLNSSTKTFSYMLQYGDMVDILNTDSKKTNFFALNYVYGQKSVASAWW